MTEITTDQGNTYRLVEIGDQCWFADNLKETPSTNQGWYGFYDEVEEEPTPGEGMLYTWDAAMNGEVEERTQGVCPTGWHVTSQCETELFRFESEIGLEDFMVVKSKLIYVGVPPSEFAAGELILQNGKFRLRGVLSYPPKFGH
ncbi:FISUMP domain-containing protein [Marinovum sp. 2_MG-2023]|uniref:FISUMP domain-containing protein n=1 Tax=unclassified Marinovum TaxID=2647166 RepID=UPI0026E13504|nr:MULTISPECIES: FISUMP domain-containing protein [unclassified Marinovum]MDO6730700.1 FISUMP domain-containing protein [Marinovum sp. 2_MG-2023]MDO6780095.1 FISUMP domain-containing protein [Marinovum sp. 1_MG-2023]